MSNYHSLGSSPGKPPIKEFKRLKEKLRKLDKKLCRFHLFTGKDDMSRWNRGGFSDEYQKLLSLDQDRKQVRNRLKGIQYLDKKF